MIAKPSLARSYKATQDMLLRTSTLTAPWTVVESNFKWFGRVKCLKTNRGCGE